MTYKRTSFCSVHCIISVLPRLHSRLAKGMLLCQEKKVKYINLSEENIQRLKNMLRMTSWD